MQNDRNLIDEEAIIDLLEKADVYEYSLSQFRPQQKLLVEKLVRLGGGVQLPAKKRKSA